MIKFVFQRMVMAILFLPMTLLAPTPSGARAADTPVLHPAIPILDEAGNHVLDSGNPYSSRTSCGTSGCHDYEKITSAFHFEMGRDESRDEYGDERNLSLLFSPGYFGGFGCMGGNNPEWGAKKVNKSADEFADLGSAGWIKRCNSCHMGGGWMEKDRNGTRYDEKAAATIAPFDGDYYNRGTDSNNAAADITTVAKWDWKKSGVVEADCMMCHADFSALVDPGGKALNQYRNLRGHDLLSVGHFRYGGTALLSYLNLKHDDGAINTDTTLVSFDRDADGHLKKNGDNLPILQWNTAAFDNNRKTTIPMWRFPASENCMNCHRTGNSRRGFYGFGADAAATYTEAGTLEEDYQDDVHYGTTFTADNGESRTIDNCSACHGRAFYNASHANVDLDANHNFLKGNSDMDLRNDLDFNPPPKTCLYCHEEAVHKVIPSGQESMLAAHRERWKASGDMMGYPESAIDRITQTHLDVVSCQACHITDKKSRGRPIQILYQYRTDEKQRLSIVPYNPRARYYWKDRGTGRMLTKTERDSVFTAAKDADGNTIGILKDPVSGDTLGRVSTRFSHGAYRYNDPDSYEGFVALKRAYDSLLTSKGITNADAVLVWTEVNQYLMSHNTRPAVSSVQCEACHNRKQNGSFSSLISENGIFGSGNVKTVTTLPDKRLVDKGIVILDKSYMKIDADGQVTETVADILFASKVNPSMTVLNAAKSGIATGRMAAKNVQSALTGAGIPSDRVSAIQDKAGLSGDLYLFKPQQGGDEVQKVALMAESGQMNDALFPNYRFRIQESESGVETRAGSAGFGALRSKVYDINATDTGGSAVTNFPGQGILIKLPYTGNETDASRIKVITSEDGSSWNAIDTDNIITVQPPTSDEEGYILFRTAHFSLFTVTDGSTGSTGGAADSGTGGSSSTGTTTVAASDDNSGDGGGATFLLPLLLLALLPIRNRLKTVANPGR